MTVQVYVGGLLAYDSRLPVEAGYSVLSIRIADRINKGGTATISLPPGHPLRNGFPAFRVPVEIYRDGKLRWRGRPLPPSDDFYLRRTIVCEGEMCFLQDAVHRPYLYQASPQEIFASVIGAYNAAVEPWKQFSVGTVTVTDPNDYIRLESQSAEDVLTVVEKMISRCGGYIFFSSTAEGGRQINWLADMPYTCNQPVTLGSNLIDFSSESDVAAFATRLIPYGAVGDDGERLKLDNGGKDYVENAEAIELRGVIERSVVYDDITTQSALLARATREVNQMSLIPSVVKLSAIDLSRQDLTLDFFAVGQKVQGESVPHQLSGSYDLTTLTEDLVNPGVGGITLTRETASLSGSDAKTLTGAIAAGDRSNGVTLDQAVQTINKNISIVQETLATSIVQTTESIILSALDEYVKTQDFETFRETVSAQFAVLTNEVNITINSVSERVEEVDGLRQVVADTLAKYFRFTGTGMYIGLDGNELQLNLDYNIMQFLRANIPQLWIDERGVHADEIHTDAIYLGDRAAITIEGPVITLRSVT